MRERALQEESVHNGGKHTGVLGMTSQGTSLVEVVAANEVGRELVQGLGCQASKVTTLLRAVGATEGHFLSEMAWSDL